MNQMFKDEILKNNFNYTKRFKKIAIKIMIVKIIFLFDWKIQLKRKSI
jgi:hypothetical protein